MIDSNGIVLPSDLLATKLQVGRVVLLLPRYDDMELKGSRESIIIQV